MWHSCRVSWFRLVSKYFSRDSRGLHMLTNLTVFQASSRVSNILLLFWVLNVSVLDLNSILPVQVYNISLGEVSIFLLRSAKKCLLNDLSQESDWPPLVEKLLCTFQWAIMQCFCWHQHFSAEIAKITAWHHMTSTHQICTKISEIVTLIDTDLVRR